MWSNFIFEFQLHFSKWLLKFHSQSIHLICGFLIQPIVSNDRIFICTSKLTKLFANLNLIFFNAKYSGQCNDFTRGHLFFDKTGIFGVLVFEVSVNIFLELRFVIRKFKEFFHLFIFINSNLQLMNEVNFPYH